MRIAHRKSRKFYFLRSCCGSNLTPVALPTDSLDRGVPRLERQALRRKVGLAHVDGHLTIRRKLETEKAIDRFDLDRVARRQALVVYIFGEAARAIAAVFYLAAVAIENAVAKVGIRARRGLDLQKLVKPNAELPVGIESDLLCAEAMRLRDTVDNHKVVAEAVHLCEGKSHLLVIGRLLHRCRDCSQSPTAKATQERVEVLPFPVREQFDRHRHRP